MVERAFRELGLARPRGPYRPKGKTRYSAAFPNQIWHVDIHSLGKKRSQILYAVIDDCTRLIIEWQHLSSKHASQTVKVIKRAIARYGPPHTIWSDNGGENKGEFLKVMRVRGINNVYIVPHCPYQNGKIERLWPNIESIELSWAKIQQWVEYYNAKPHLALPTHYVNGKQIHYSPSEMWKKLPIWKRGIPAKWIVDGVSQDFLPGSLMANEMPELQGIEEDEWEKEGEEVEEEENKANLVEIEEDSNEEEEYEVNYEEEYQEDYEDPYEEDYDDSF
ncbi:integrase core domain-containing protein [Trichomonas vaginalis G3]|uniref:integrase core domain-containing protein n=1 Tax=Trichomonas vaginalis (strain ATCC PRA-98 / G3) TaxID=412133 RepID=UPI0021E5C917|nr:integrase core domain-containing protein [Trichomonas vaginalis G3]KAI5508488.1 integrase core domain-containing protein [Trichomonas vaginalis G3]